MKSNCPVFRNTFNIGDILICPVCKKEFKANKNTAYALTSGYTCSWKCFKKFVDKNPTNLYHEI